MNELLDYYIYGLCASDGTMSITKRNSKISYCESIEMSEEQILKDIANDININIRSRNRVINKKGRTFYRISIPIKYFSGIEEYFRPNRIGLFDFFYNIPDKEKHNFIRGLFDGDGSVAEHPKLRNRLRIGFSINSKCTDILKILEYIESLLEIKMSKYFDRRGNGSYYYSINSISDVTKFYNYIYNSPKYFLKRKYNVFIQHGFPDLVTGLSETS
jgi:hypothetical protein